MQKRKVSFTFKREKLFPLEIQERIYPYCGGWFHEPPPAAPLDLGQ